MSASAIEPTVFLVDDDATVRAALRRGLVAEGFPVRLFESADDFLAEDDPALPGCLIADVAMPGMSGLELQSLLAARGYSRPMIFITGKGSIPMSVQAMRAGAITFLPKPVRLGELAAAVREAFERDRQRREEQAERTQVESRLKALTGREREVLELIVIGKLNKQIAAELGAAEKTIKVHRGRVMAKLNVRSVAELVNLTARLIRHAESPHRAG
ncbi:MAG TPA: response regulator [Steroidobacteraceae bacterium]|jgi:FixJ family two-component response regulator|nr:response regulator [Steroidobacteraceae bacterium]